MGLSKKQQRVIEQLDRNVAMCREFMNDWLLFNQILSAYPSPGVNKAQLENQFLKIKSKLAREHKVLKETLGLDYHLDANTMNIVAGATSLETIYNQSEIAVKKLQSEWHRAFISINETLGGIEDKKARAEAGEKIFVAPTGGTVVGGARGGKGGGGLSKNTVTAVVVVLVIVAIVGVMWFIPPIREFYIQTFQQLGIMER